MVIEQKGIEQRIALWGEASHPEPPTCVFYGPPRLWEGRDLFAFLGWCRLLQPLGPGRGWGAARVSQSVSLVS